MKIQSRNKIPHLQMVAVPKDCAGAVQVDWKDENGVAWRDHFIWTDDITLDKSQLDVICIEQAKLMMQRHAVLRGKPCKDLHVQHVPKSMWCYA